MNEKPISPLRRRMIEDMTVRNFVEKTRNDYIRHVRDFTAFLRRTPDTATAEDLRRFQLHQTQTGVRPPTINSSVAALRFFFGVTLDRPELGRHLTFVHEPRRTPVILSLEEVGRLLEAAPGPKYKAALGCYRGASTASATMVCLPAAPAPKISPAPANCSPCRSRKLRRSMPAPPTITSRTCPHIPVRAAAAACSRSRPSRAAPHRIIAPQPQTEPSRSTHHDHDRCATVD